MFYSGLNLSGSGFQKSECNIKVGRAGIKVRTRSELTKYFQIFTYVFNTSMACVYLAVCETHEQLKSSEMFTLQGVDIEEKEKGSKADANKADATKLFGANTPTVSCSFESE